MPVFTPTVVPKKITVAMLALSARSTVYTPTVVPPSTGSRTVVMEFIEPSLAYSSIVLGTTGLVVYWRLGEGAGTIAQDRAGGYDATYYNSPKLGVPGAIVGDTAVYFARATSHYAMANYAAAFDVGDTFSIEFWLQRASVGTEQVVIDRYTHFRLYLSTANLLILSSSGAAPVVHSRPAITDTAAFHHYVVTKSGTTRHIYIDGMADEVLDTNRTLANAVGQPVRLAGDVFGNLLDGTLDDLSFYNVALTATQVLTRYNAGRAAGGPRSPTVFFDSPVFAPTIYRP